MSSTDEVAAHVAGTERALAVALTNTAVVAVGHSIWIDVASEKVVVRIYFVVHGLTATRLKLENLTVACDRTLADIEASERPPSCRKYLV
jgi:hypothetical protein